MTDVAVLGVRHHGPGSARSVGAALDELEPDVVLVEGPPELDPLAPLAADPGLVPPVAALVYAVEQPRRAAFYPFAAFSPEWVALRWAAARQVPVRFADLPAAHLLAPVAPGSGGEDGGGEDDGPPATGPRPDPIGTLARAAGYDDPERWWEDAVEHRPSSPLETFDLLREAMAEVRARLAYDAGPGFTEDAETLVREAAMRRVLRAVLKDGAGRVAFVCGAYHAPAVHPDAFPPATRDARLLTRLPRIKVAATWAPWSARRLALASGYGAGVTSPGWYAHLFATRESGAPDDEVVPRWLTRVARTLRDVGHDAPPASVVDATRLAEALAGLRGRPSVGLAELDDAARAVLTEGSRLPLRAVDERLVVGEEIGRVPDSVPLTPLAQDLARHQRTLRLKLAATPTTITLDLRRELGRGRSVLLHRLRLLGVPWGEQVDAGGTTGTFKEAWRLVWEPELAVAVVEASLHGTTVAAATGSRVAELAAEAPDLATLGRLVEACLVAELDDGLARVVAALAERTARQHDVLALLQTVEPLARTRRYGDVRGADTSRVAAVLETVVARASVGLRAAAVSLDEDAATVLRAAVDATQRGVALLDDPALTEPWRRALGAVAEDDRVAPGVSGRVNRVLLDVGDLAASEVADRLSRRLSRGADALQAAGWLDGFLDGDAVLLLHDPALLGLVDAWVAEVDDATYEDLLPLLRRTFSRFAPAERRSIGTRLRSPGRREATTPVDVDRGLAAAARVAALLGWRPLDGPSVEPVETPDTAEPGGAP